MQDTTAAKTEGDRNMTMMMFFTLPQVERLTGLSRATVRRWENQGVFEPEHADPLEFSGPYQRIYTFRDVVGLRTLALLRKQHGIDLSEIRDAGAYLKSHVSSPWSSLRFWVVNGHVAFRDPSSQHAVAGAVGQRVVSEVFLEPIAKQVEQESRVFQERGAETVGQVSRNRNIMSNKWVIAGARIPTHIIQEYADHGYTTDEIIAEYPDLNQKDIQTALKHEGARRTNAA